MTRHIKFIIDIQLKYAELNISNINLQKVHIHMRHQQFLNFRSWLISSLKRTSKIQYVMFVQYRIFCTQLQHQKQFNLFFTTFVSNIL